MAKVMNIDTRIAQISSVKFSFSEEEMNLLKTFDNVDFNSV